MKLVLGLGILLYLSGCASRPDELLGASIAALAYISIFLISAVIYYLIKGAKFLVGITPEVEKENLKKLIKKNKKKYHKQILEDKKFVKRTYKQYVSYHQQKFPKSKYPKASNYLSQSGWFNEREKVKKRIETHERAVISKKIQNLTDKEFIKLPFEKSGYSNYQIWVDRLARAKVRVRHNKYDKKVKLLKVKDYE